MRKVCNECTQQKPVASILLGLCKRVDRARRAQKQSLGRDECVVVQLPASAYGLDRFEGSRGVEDCAIACVCSFVIQKVTEFATL